MRYCWVLLLGCATTRVDQPPGYATTYLETALATDDVVRRDEQLRLAIVAEPGSARAEKALSFLSQAHQDENTPDQLVVELQKLSIALACLETDADARRLSCARLYLLWSKNLEPAASLELLNQTQDLILQTVYWDDFLYARATLLEAMHQALPAIEDLQAIVSSHQSSWWIGSYTSHFYYPALFAMARLYEAQQSYEMARELYQKLLDDETPTTLQDQARAKLLTLP